MILFAAVEPDDCQAAYQWHRGFAGANNALYPRDHDQFQSLVIDGSVWAAKSPAGDYLGLAYASYDEERKICEIGGLMVATQARKVGLGTAITKLTLAHMILEEDLLSIEGVRIIARVLKKSNPKPRGILEIALKFVHCGNLQIPTAELPGLRAEDGYVMGEEFEIALPDTVIALADWAASWDGRMGSTVAHVELREGVDMQHWAQALREIANRCGGC